MGQPGQFNPQGEDWIGRKLADLERQIRELRAANIFGLTGITPQDGGTDFDGYANFNGNMKVTGTLELPAGIIGNDALTDPNKPFSSHVDVAGFSLTTGANVEKVRSTIAVPPGFTTALVYATATMSAYNGASTTDGMYLSCTINGAGPGYSSQVSVAPATIGSLSNTSAGLLNSLSGTFYVTAKASSASLNWAANGSTTINLDTIVIFMR